MVVQNQFTMKNLRKVSYKDLMAQKNYEFMISNGARYCDAEEIKQLIIEGLSYEEAIWEYSVDWVLQLWNDLQESDYLFGPHEISLFIQEFLTEQGIKDLEQECIQRGVPKQYCWDLMMGGQYPFFPNLFGCSVKTAIQRIKDYGFTNTKTHAIGGGEWSLEIYGEEGDFLFEFVGSNGTRGEADDLRGQLDELLDLV